MHDDASEQRLAEDVSFDAAAGMFAPETRLIDVLEFGDVSVRLRNSITAAYKASVLPFATVADYLRAGSSAPWMMRTHVRSFGRKTANELDQLIREGCSQSCTPAPQLMTPELRAQLLALFEHETLGSLADQALFSARLTHLFRTENLASMPFSDVICDFLSFTNSLLNLANCGRKSVGEFRHFILDHLRFRLLAEGFEEPDPLIETLLGHPLKQLHNYRFTPGELGRHGPVAECGEPGSDAGAGHNRFVVPEHDSLVERLEWLMRDFTPRDQDILRRRYGIGQDDSETLEEIGRALNVTRERIRQIQAKKSNLMRLRMKRAPIDELLRAETTTLWTDLAGDSGIILRNNLEELSRSLDPYHDFALCLLDISLESWLDEEAQPFPYGWLAPNADREPIDALAPRLEDVARDWPLPQTLHSLLGEEAFHGARLAVPLIIGRPMLHGYLLPSRPGGRLSRLVRLHAAAASEPGVWAIDKLVQRYRNSFAVDACSTRDAEAVMAAAPQLFLELEEGSWLAIGAPGEFVDPPSADLNIPARGEEEGTIPFSLQIALEERGPTRLSELLDAGTNILPEGRSANSIGPTLVMRRDLFARVLPGVYATQGQVQDFVIPAEWPTLFSEAQARFYALARYAGEPRSIFPFWSVETETALCRWARHSGSDEVFASLLSVAAVDEWFVSDEDRREWARLKQQKGRYMVGANLRHGSAYYDAPDLDRLAAACHIAARDGSFNWVAGNRLTARKIDSHGGAGLVALMVQLGALEEPEDQGFRWQRPHRATNEAARLADALSAEFVAHGIFADWDRGLGLTLARRAASAPASSDSWVDAAAVSAMFDSRHSEEIAIEDIDPLEAVILSQRRARDAEQRQATLAWLLEE